jgi:chromosomal replication initiation ATPase DnaA
MSWQNWINSNGNFSDIEIVEYLIQRDGLNSKCKNTELVFKRSFLYKVLINNPDMTKSKIGEMFNRTHSSVIHGLNSYELDKDSFIFKNVTSEYELIFITKELIVKSYNV